MSLLFDEQDQHEAIRGLSSSAPRIQKVIFEDVDRNSKGLMDLNMLNCDFIKIERQRAISEFEHLAMPSIRGEDELNQG